MPNNSKLAYVLTAILLLTVFLTACQQVPGAFTPVPGLNYDEKIAVIKAESLYVVFPATGNYTVFLPEKNCVYSHPSWSPIGYVIALTSDCGENTHVVILNTANKQVEQLVDFESSNPEWSPDGKKIAFESSEYGTNGIFQVEVNKYGKALEEPRLVITTNSQSDMSWTPDGNLLYVAPNAKTGTNGIFMVDPSSEEVTEIVAIPKVDLSGPRMSAGGVLVFTATSSDGTSDIRAIAGTFPRAGAKIITLPKSHVSNPDWSPDGKVLLYVDDTGIRIIDQNQKTWNLGPGTVAAWESSFH